jgi:hypothetical protein
MITDEMIAAAERVLAEATPGQWRVESCNMARDHEACKIVSDERNEYGHEMVVVDDYNHDECNHSMRLVDARAIVVAQQMAPEWLAEIKTARAEEKAAKALANIADECRLAAERECRELRAEIAKVLHTVREIDGAEAISLVAGWCTWCARKCDEHGECGCA